MHSLSSMRFKTVGQWLFETFETLESNNVSNPLPWSSVGRVVVKRSQRRVAAAQVRRQVLQVFGLPLRYRPLSTYVKRQEKRYVPTN